MLDALIAEAKTRGYVFYDEIDALLPEDPPNGTAVSKVFAELARADIRIRETARDPGVLPTPIPEGADEPLNIYSREVSKVPHLTPGREIILGSQMRTGGLESERAKKELFEGNLYLVIPLAQLHPDKNMHLLDVIQQGNLGLMKAADAFDPEGGYPFTTYALWWTRRAIRRIPPALPLKYPHKLVEKTD